MNSNHKLVILVFVLNVQLLEFYFCITFDAFLFLASKTNPNSLVKNKSNFSTLLYTKHENNLNIVNWQGYLLFK